jgi:predicted LPLAT superfamily acyltransferase
MEPAMTSPARAAGKGHWAQINEAGFVAGMRLLFWIWRVLGRWPFRLVLYPVLAWYLLARPTARAASAAYLQKIAAFRGASSVTPGMPAVMRHFAAFAECILDKLLLWGGWSSRSDTRFFGTGQLDDDIARQRGGLIICSHFGNLELCRVLARQRTDLKLTVLVHTRHAQKFNQLLAQLDPGSQLNLLQVTEMSPVTAMLLNERVARGEFVVIAGDRVPVSSTSRTCEACFLGETARFPIGPYVLASLLQCPVYLMFSMRVGQCSEIHFEHFRDTIRLPRKTRDVALSALAQAYAERLQHFCLRAPFQWFNFYDFWGSSDMDTTNASR